MRLFSHPFRLGADGTVVTVDQDSEAATGQALGALIATVRGERTLTPAFGITDPVFQQIEPAEIDNGIDLFWPPELPASQRPRVTSVDVTYPTADSERVVVNWEPDGSVDGSA